MRVSSVSHVLKGSSHKPKRTVRRVCALLGVLGVLLVVAGRGGRSAAREGALLPESPARARVENLAGITGGGSGTASGLGRKPPVAVYFTGQARTLRRTLCSIRKHVLDPLVSQGFVPVVFVAGELDGDSGDFQLLLGSIPDVELGGVLIVPRPGSAVGEENARLSLASLADAKKDPVLPPIPNACLAVFKKKARWFHDGGDATDSTSKNNKYTDEVLAQIWYRNVVDRMRIQWQTSERGKLAGAVQWVLSPRPDNVYVNDVPNLNELAAAGNMNQFDDDEAGETASGKTASNRKHNSDVNVSGTLWIPSWGLGHDLSAGKKWRNLFGYLTVPNVFNFLSGKQKRTHASKKNRPGENNRFAVGGLNAVSVYHDLYVTMCYGGLVRDLPSGVNFEQMVRWYFDHPRVAARGLRRTIPLPGDFWFFRLRKSVSPNSDSELGTIPTPPLEHPGHEPSLVPFDWRPGALMGHGNGGVQLYQNERKNRSKKSQKQVVEDERWRLWSLAASEAWRCDDAAFSPNARFAEKKGECLLREMRSEWVKTGWLRNLVPWGVWARKLVFPGGWLEKKISKRCQRA